MRAAAEEAAAPWRDGQVLAVDAIRNDLALTAPPCMHPARRDPVHAVLT